MQALVLVGGEGTRLRPLTLTQPKPAVTLVDRPIIRFMVDWLARHGVDDVIMACGFRADRLRNRLGEGGGGGPRIRYLEEPEPLGTAGPIRFAADQLDERFLALNGDVLSDLDLSALIRQHEERGALGTLALYPVPDVTGYGLVRRREDGEITEFVEKPEPAQVDTNEVNAGAYVLERSVIDRIPPGRAVSIERESFPRLVGQGLYGLRLEGYWMDIGTPERYLQASWDILERQVETEVGERLDADGLLVADGAQVNEAMVRPPALIAAGSEIENGARVGPRAVIGPDCMIGTEATVTGSVLLAGCRIGPGAFIDGAIVAGGVELGAAAEIGRGAVLGERARVKAGARVEAGDRIAPATPVR